MRHRVAGRHLSRTSEHRLALRRNMVASLFEHETISTTLEKAKEVRGFAEKLITLSKKGTLPARRRANAILNNRANYAE
jgi:large subunit ribosomal protein L17